MDEELREIINRVEDLEDRQLKDYEHLISNTVKITRFLKETTRENNHGYKRKSNGKSL